MSLSYHLTSDSISVSFPTTTGRHSEAIGSSDSRYGPIVKLLKELVKLGDEDKEVIYQQIQSIITREGLKKGAHGLVLRDGKLYINNDPLPSALSARVLQFEREQLPYKYLVSFFKKLQKNPLERSKDMLYKFLEHNGHPITDEGNFIAYRSVTSDWKDHRTHKMDNSIGAVVEMRREDVNPDPSQTCSTGLHVATRDYAQKFNRGNLVEVEVDPQDVVCVPNDYDGTKMRVCKFKIIGVSENLREEVLIKVNPDKEEEATEECFQCCEGLGLCVCERCERCDVLVSDCDCDYCIECDSFSDECECTYCEECTKLVDNGDDLCFDCECGAEFCYNPRSNLGKIMEEDFCEECLDDSKKADGELCSECDESPDDCECPWCEECSHHFVEEAENQFCYSCQEKKKPKKRRTKHPAAPARFNRKPQGGFITSIEVRSGNVTVELKTQGTYRYYNVDQKSINELYSLLNNNDQNVFSFVSNNIINHNYKYKKI